MERPLDRLFKIAKSYNPALAGQELRQTTDELVRQQGSAESEIHPVYLSARDPHTALKSLQRAIQKAHPEVNAAYWRVRCWSLFCWQPLYLTMISVYQLKAVPLSLQSMAQTQQNEMIAGYLLADGPWQEAGQETLIKTACTQLSRLFNVFQTALIEEYGGKAPLYQALLADQVMSILVALDNKTLQRDSARIKADFLLWAEGLDLPSTATQRLHEQENQSVAYIRQTCCLHFRRKDGYLCPNCPRVHKKTMRQSPTKALC